MTFEVKPGDVVVVARSSGEEYLLQVKRLTRTQVVTVSWSPDRERRFSREDGQDLSNSGTRWTRRDCIVRLATPKQAAEHIATIHAEHARIAKYREMEALFQGLPATELYHKDGRWALKLMGLTENQLHLLAGVLRSEVEVKRG